MGKWGSLNRTLVNDSCTLHSGHLSSAQGWQDRREILSKWIIFGHNCELLADFLLEEGYRSQCSRLPDEMKEQTNCSLTNCAFLLQDQIKCRDTGCDIENNCIELETVVVVGNNNYFCQVEKAKQQFKFT